MTTDEVSDTWPAWSPDGLRIAFASHRTGEYQIWIMSSSGEHQMPLTAFDKTIVVAPAWSPDGSRLCYEKVDPTTHISDVWMIRMR